MNEDEEVVIVLVTAPSDVVADGLAESILKERLAACINRINGVVSTYRWEGAVTKDDEVLLVIKTRAQRVAALRDHVLSAHPYEVPEFLVIPVLDGSAPYLAWIRAMT